MTFLKASRLLMLGVLLFGLAGASFGAVRWDVVPSPTEVVNTGRSEVTGSVNLIVNGAGSVTGTASGGFAQIGLIYTNPAMQIDNLSAAGGVKIFYSSGFSTGAPTIVAVENRDINGRCSGFITINIQPNQTPVQGDFIRIEGVRGRIDASQAITPGTDLYVDLQSINDPAANTFTPDRVRVAKSLDGMNVTITPDTYLLCFAPTGKVSGGGDSNIVISEGFARAFVDLDSNIAGVDSSDRVDSGNVPTATAPAFLGAPTNSTQFIVWIEGIPASVAGVTFPASSSTSDANSALSLISSAFSGTAGTATATYSYEATNQTGESDITYESFELTIVPTLKTDSQTAVGTAVAGVTLGPAYGAASGCASPSNSPYRPRFLQMWESDTVATNNPPDDPFRPIWQIIRCNCYLLFTYVTADANYTTGISIANTTGDSAPFGANEAADQLGKVTFYFYDKTGGYKGSTTTAADVLSGNSYVGLVSEILPTGVTSFTGYLIVKTDFQFCHGFAFIADINFGKIAHGYLGNVIPDPAIKNLSTRRAPSAAADATNIPAGESLNN